MMKLLLAVLCAAVAVAPKGAGGATPGADATPTPPPALTSTPLPAPPAAPAALVKKKLDGPGGDVSKIVVQVDIGSGGTRLSVFTVDKDKNGGRPEVCKFDKTKSSTGTDALCTNENVVPDGRVTPSSNYEGWCGPKPAGAGSPGPECGRKYGGIAFKLLDECVKEIAANSLNCDIETSMAFWKNVKVIVTATAGSRRGIVAKTLEGKAETDFVGTRLLDSLKLAGVMDKTPGGGVIDGSMEAYFGYTSLALKIAELQSSTNPAMKEAVPTADDFKKNWGFLEIGGASQQFAWWDNGISNDDAKRPKFKSLANLIKANLAFLEVQGDMFHKKPEVFPGTAINKVFASSLLGTGGDRMDIALIKHFMNDGNTKPRTGKDPAHAGVKDDDSNAGNTPDKSIGNPCFVMEESPGAGVGLPSKTLELVYGYWLKPKTGQYVDYQEAHKSFMVGKDGLLDNQLKSMNAVDAPMRNLPIGWEWQPGPVASSTSGVGILQHKPWKMNVFTDIKDDEQLMKFLKGGGKITNMKFENPKKHRSACVKALANIYKKDNSESLDKSAFNGELQTNPYRYMFTYFKDNYDVSRKNVGGVKTPITHLAVIGKATQGAYGCTEHKNAKTNNWCDVKFDDLVTQGTTFGCAIKATDEFKNWDISACRAVAEPYQMQQQVMSDAKPTFVFIDNDFAQGAAAFAVAADPAQIRRYTTDSTFKAEAKLWTGQIVDTKGDGTPTVDSKGDSKGDGTKGTPASAASAASAAAPVVKEMKRFLLR